MFTKYEQIEQWVADFQLKKWEFSPQKNFEEIVCRTDWFGDVSNEEKLERSRKYIEDCGRKLYGRGYNGTSPNSPAIFCEVQIDTQQPPMPVAGYMQPAPAAIDMDEYAKKLRKEFEVEHLARDLERREKELAEEMREFRKDKESAMGLLVGYVKPILGGAVSAISGGRPARIHGVDAPADVEAERIHAAEAEAEESVFTDEESDKLFDLLARFKKVEPDYLVMIEKVVTMAETQDPMYGMAKNFLTK